MNYEIIELKEKTITGLTARTGNSSPDCQKIIGGLWQEFMANGIWSGIKNKANSYCVGLYSGYDFADMTYDVTVGAEVSAFENSELCERTVPAGKYAVFNVKGDVVTDVSAAWSEIWKMTLDGSFVCDFEEYLSNENGVSDVNIYISLK